MSARPLRAAAAGAFLILAAPLPALAQPAAPPAAQATAPPPGRVSPEAEALVRRYLAATHFERNMDNMMVSMLPLMNDQLKRQSPSLTDEQRQIVLDVVRKLMREKMTPKMIERMTPIYAATFTLPELRALVAFYESPVGASIMEKMPSLAPKSAAITRELMPELTRDAMLEVLTRMCPDGKCDAAKLPKPAAS